MKRDLTRLAANTYDVLIIGGGIYGICAAWDAALRGLSVALLEKGDFGHATSSNTLRVIHGGLRYLQHGDLRRLRHSIQERSTFMRIAPHLVHPLPFVIPTYGHGLRGKEALFTALLINDLIGFDRNRLQDPQKHLPPGRVISKQEFLRMFSGVEATGLTGGAIVYDCQMFSSERLVISLARSAALASAEIANYVEVFGLLKNGDRIAGVKARDLLTGCEFEVRARVVVNTSGPWLDRVLSLCDGRSPGRSPALSKAFNILIERQLIPRYAMGIYTKTRFKDRDAVLSKGARLLFLAPWHDRTLIGTVHLPYDCEADQCRVTEDEIQTFLDEVNDAYPAASLRREDVCFTYGGLLPMANHGQGGVRLVKQYRIRDHKKEDGIDGLISVMGVKFTEARHVAERVVDLLFKKLGKTAPRSATAVTPVYGGQIERFEEFVIHESRKRSGEMTAESVRLFIQHYGSAYSEVLKYLTKGSDSTRAAVDFSQLIRAEVLHGIREEMAIKLTDVIFRRTTVGLPGRLLETSIKACAAIMAEELGWDEDRLRSETEKVRTALYHETVSGRSLASSAAA